MNIIHLECSDDIEMYVGDSRSERSNGYNVNDCVLVRTTDIFPFDGVVQTPINGNAYSFASSSLIGNAILEVLRERYQYEKIEEERKKYEVCFETLRTTIHFTINGLVSSHLYGDFDGRDYVVIEPLKYHVEDSSLCSLNAGDTYFNDDMLLSDEAVLLITENKFNEIKEDERYLDTLSRFKIYVWNGKNQQEALKMTLESLGYDCFVVNSHGYVNGFESGMNASLMWDFLGKIREKYGISGEKHFYSEINYQDKLNRNKKGREIDKEHLFYILDNSNVPVELVEKINEYNNFGLFDSDNYEAYYNKYGMKEVFVEVIKRIGLDKVEVLTREFNDKYIKQLDSSRKGVGGKRH